MTKPDAALQSILSYLQKKQHKRVYWKKLRPGIPQDPFLPAVIEEEENPMGPVQGGSLLDLAEF